MCSFRWDRTHWPCLRSVRHCPEALQVAESLESCAHLADIYHLCYVIDGQAGRYKESLRSLEEYSECMNRLYVERKEDAIFELRSKYEREKGRNEIRAMQEAHRQKIRRDRMFLVSAAVVIVFAVLAVGFPFCPNDSYCSYRY